MTRSSSSRSRRRQLAHIPLSSATVESLSTPAQGVDPGSTVASGSTGLPHPAEPPLKSRAELENENAGLKIALTTNRQIGAAVGILMVQRGLCYDEAFAELRQASQRTNRPLRELAEELVSTGVLDDRRGAGRSWGPAGPPAP